MDSSRFNMQNVKANTVGYAKKTWGSARRIHNRLIARMPYRHKCCKMTFC